MIDALNNFDLSNLINRVLTESDVTTNDKQENDSIEHKTEDENLGLNNQSGNEAYKSGSYGNAIKSVDYLSDKKTATNSSDIFKHLRKYVNKIKPENDNFTTYNMSANDVYESNIIHMMIKTIFDYYKYEVADFVGEYNDIKNLKYTNLIEKDLINFLNLELAVSTYNNPNFEADDNVAIKNGTLLEPLKSIFIKFADKKLYKTAKTIFALEHQNIGNEENFHIYKELVWFPYNNDSYNKHYYYADSGVSFIIVESNIDIAKGTDISKTISVELMDDDFAKLHEGKSKKLVERIFTGISVDKFLNDYEYIYTSNEFNFNEIGKKYNEPILYNNAIYYNEDKDGSKEKLNGKKSKKKGNNIIKDILTQKFSEIISQKTGNSNIDSNMLDYLLTIYNSKDKYVHTSEKKNFKLDDLLWFIPNNISKDFEVWSNAATNYDNTNIDLNLLISSYGNLINVKNINPYYDLIKNTLFPDGKLENSENEYIKQFLGLARNEINKISNKNDTFRKVLTINGKEEDAAIASVIIEGYFRVKGGLKQGGSYNKVFYTFNKANIILDQGNEINVMYIPESKKFKDLANNKQYSSSSLTIDHKNGVHEYNHYTNLRLSTTKENAKYQGKTAKSIFKMTPNIDAIQNFINVLNIGLNKLKNIQGQEQNNLNNNEIKVEDINVNWELVLSSKKRPVNTGNGVINVNCTAPIATLNGDALKIMGNTSQYLTLENNYTIVYNNEKYKLYNLSLSFDYVSGGDDKAINYSENKNLSEEIELTDRICHITNDYNTDRIFFLSVKEFREAVRDIITIEGEYYNISDEASLNRGGRIGYTNNIELGTLKDRFSNIYPINENKLYTDNIILEASKKNDKEKGANEDDYMNNSINKYSVHTEKKPLYGVIEYIAGEFSRLIPDKNNNINSIISEGDKTYRKYIARYSTGALSFTLDLGLRNPNTGILKEFAKFDIPSSWKGGVYMSNKNNIEGVIDEQGKINTYEIFKSIRSGNKSNPPVKEIPVVSILGVNGSLKLIDGKVKLIQSSGQPILKNGYRLLNSTEKESFYTTKVDSVDLSSAAPKDLLDNLRNIKGYTDTLSLSSPSLHILSASAWHYDEYKKIASEYPNETIVVHHINGSKYDYKPDNLAWVSGKDNTLFDTGKGIALFRVSPVGEEQVIAAWLTKAEYGNYIISSPADKGYTTLNVDLENHQFYDAFTKNKISLPKITSNDNNIDNYLEKSDTIRPTESVNPSNDFSYILRNVVMKDERQDTRKSLFENVVGQNLRRVIGYKYNNNYYFYSYNNEKITSNLEELITKELEINQPEIVLNNIANYYLKGRFNKENTISAIKMIKPENPEETLINLVKNIVDKINFSIKKNIKINIDNPMAESNNDESDKKNKEFNDFGLEKSIEKSKIIDEKGYNLFKLDEKIQNLFWDAEYSIISNDSEALSRLLKYLDNGQLFVSTFSKKMIKSIVNAKYKEGRKGRSKTKAINEENFFQKTVNGFANNYFDVQKLYRDGNVLLNEAYEKFKNSKKRK